jgi:hypothetical protein
MNKKNSKPKRGVKVLNALVKVLKKKPLKTIEN